MDLKQIKPFKLARTSVKLDKQGTLSVLFVTFIFKLASFRNRNSVAIYDYWPCKTMPKHCIEKFVFKMQKRTFVNNAVFRKLVSEYYIFRNYSTAIQSQSDTIFGLFQNPFVPKVTFALNFPKVQLESRVGPGTNFRGPRERRGQL